MIYKKLILLLALSFVLSSCYHARIVTDKEPSGKKIEKSFAPSFIAGLVPPSVTDVTRRCDNGIARVETKLSFVNRLVAGITFSIFTPMSIEVQCAKGSSMSALNNGNNKNLSISTEASEKNVKKTISKAAKQSQKSNQAIYVNLN